MTDPNYEFEAPQFVDFNEDQVNDPEADAWFEAQENPAEDDVMEASELAEVAKPPRRSMRKRIREPEITVPHTPQFATASRVDKVKMPTSEELELMKIEEERQELAKRRKLNASTKEKAFSVHGPPVPPKSNKPLTEPTTPVFRTDARLKSKHPMELRSQTKKTEKKTQGPTRPIEFKFASTTRHRVQTDDATPASPFVPLAQRVKKYQTATPKRFRRKPRGYKPAIPTKFSTAAQVQPKSPKFRTTKRSRTEHIKSQQEKEEEQIRHMKAYKFKARPLNPRVLESAGDIGVPKVPKVPITTAHTPQFATRARARGIEQTEDEAEKQFKARPIKHYRTRQAIIAAAEPTVPQSPALTTKLRATHRPNENVEESEIELFKAQPMPEAAPFNVRHEQRTTKARPFNLRTSKRPIKESQYMEDEYKFQARPMMDYDEPMVPMPSNKPLTEHKPFNLESQRLHEAQIARLEAEKRAVEEENELMKEFRAQPIPYSNDAPTFVVEKSDKPLTEIQEFGLSTDVRADVQAGITAERRARERQLEVQRIQREAEQTSREAMVVKDMRKTMTHKAQPIRKYRLVGPTHVPKQPTQAYSPALRTRSRVRV